jgi:hypothetical protein
MRTLADTLRTLRWLMVEVANFLPGDPAAALNAVGETIDGMEMHDAGDVLTALAAARARVEGGKLVSDSRTPIQRLRGRLGRCTYCWKPSAFTATISGLTDDDEATASVTVHLCAAHQREWFDALTSVPHEGTAEFRDGHALRWSKPDMPPSTPAGGEGTDR